MLSKMGSNECAKPIFIEKKSIYGILCSLCFEYLKDNLLYVSGRIFIFEGKLYPPGKRLTPRGQRTYPRLTGGLSGLGPSIINDPFVAL